MKPDNISDAVGQVDGDIVASAQERRSSGERGYVKPWVRVVAIAVCCCIIFISYWRNNRTETGYAIAEAVYPKMAQYPDEGGMSGGAYDKWQVSRQAQLNQPEGYADGIDGFFETSIRQFLSGAGDENRVYSPLNVFMALSMLAEVTDGNSRAQILDALGASDIGELRTQTTAVWNANYCDDGAVTSILANSLWLNRDLTFVNSTMETLATTYYASSYSGKMGSEEFNQALRDWINEQTGGLLEEQSSDLELNPETVMALAGTIYYQAKWAEQFSKSDTESGTFYSPAGDITCDFMHQSFSKGYCRSGNFTAVMQNLRNSGGMWLILPREGVSIDELIADDDVTDMILPQREWANIEYPIVNLAMPKFDIVSDI
ncbi:MAG: serpin family protein, partial [Clostridiales bacterium]|nr:serpin family protein [Clostridiales bacterium]